MAEFVFGVDGGGTSTRAVVAHRAGGRVLGRGTAGPSALGQGVPQAWRNVESACRMALRAAGLAGVPWDRCALGAGLSGAGNRAWRDAFLAADPGWGHITVESDSFALLLGAHAGACGAIVIAGTGSVAEALLPDGTRRVVGGWGFPVGDEGSGAWLGLQALRHAQAALDGRERAGPLARHLWMRCGGDRESLHAWCDRAGQFGYAQLAPAVFEFEAADDAAACLLARAADALEALVRAVDPQARLPLCVGGSVARRLAQRLPPSTQARAVAPDRPADEGALLLVQHHLATSTESVL